MSDKHEVSPKKEQRAFSGWLIGLVIVLIASVAIGAYILHTHRDNVVAGQTAH